MPKVDEELADETQDEQSGEMPGVPEGWQRVVRCPTTGRRFVARRPGERMVTSEEIYKILEDFP